MDCRESTGGYGNDERKVIVVNIRSGSKKGPKTRTSIVQNSCITLMNGFDPLKMTTVYT